jgi:hypothetical protein
MFKHFRKSEGGKGELFINGKYLDIYNISGVESPPFLFLSF